MSDRSNNNRRLPTSAAGLAPKGDAEAGQRIAKVMARAGLTSRRDAEGWIAAGRVAINDVVVTSPGIRVGPHDRVTVDGKPLPQRHRTRLFLFHKPRGLVTTTADPEGRPTVFAALPQGLPRLISIGRLDFNTEGLLLLTNDGGLARVLEHPQTGWLRRYRVRARGSVTQAQLDALRDGITIDGIHYGPIEARLDRPQGANVWLTFAIREGKNREVRNVLGALDLQVNRLIRISFGPFQLGELAEGAVEEVPTAVLREQLGKKIAALADADFDAPLNRRQSSERDPSGGPGQVPKARADAARAAMERSPPGRHGSGKRFPRTASRPLPDEDIRPPRRRPWHGRGRERPIADHGGDAETPRKTSSGLLTDRKGRRVLVERTRSEAPPEELRDQPRNDRRHGPPNRRRGPPDRRHGPRPSRPRTPRDKG
jgi:23S rRNA pseudouridine2605 synthase